MHVAGIIESHAAGLHMHMHVHESTEQLPVLVGSGTAKIGLQKAEHSSLMMDRMHDNSQRMSKACQENNAYSNSVFSKKSVYLLQLCWLNMMTMLQQQSKISAALLVR